MLKTADTAKGKTFVNNTFAEISEPRALELSEIPGIIDDFKRGTENAIAAGCERSPDWAGVLAIHQAEQRDLFDGALSGL